MGYSTTEQEDRVVRIAQKTRKNAVLKSLITEQKSKCFLSMREEFFERQLEEHKHYLQRNKNVFESLLGNGKLLAGDDDVQQAEQGDN